MSLEEVAMAAAELLEVMAKQSPPPPVLLWHKGPQIAKALRAALAEAEGAEPRRDLSDEHMRALRESHEHDAENQYFKARPQIDYNDRPHVFNAGFERGWDAAIAVLRAAGDEYVGKARHRRQAWTKCWTKR